ncbi:MAG: LytTR family DNA-binding domain-containing protein [Ginsengibacter sp.]
MLAAIAIDDEPIALEVVKSLASKISFIDVAAYFTNAFEAAKYLQQNKVDLIFLDIKMPDISGIDFLKSLSHPPMVIFTTAYSEHAVQSFELDATDYLLKPFSQARFLKACNKAYEQYSLKKSTYQSIETGKHIFIKTGAEQVRVALDDILYVESKGNYMQFVLLQNKLISRLTMNEAEALLPLTQFARVHRSYIISKKHISKMTKNSVWIKDTELPIGSGFLKNLPAIT